MSSPKGETISENVTKTESKESTGNSETRIVTPTPTPTTANPNTISASDCNFACKRCCQPLKLHNSFGLANEQMINELIGVKVAVSGGRGVNVEGKSDDLQNVHRLTTQFRSSNDDDNDSNGNGNGGFLVIGDSTVGILSHHHHHEPAIHPTSSSASSTPFEPKPRIETLSYQLNVTSRLFDILSDQSDVDHPLCEECADFLIDQMDQNLRVLEDECKDYREFLESLDRNAEEEGECSEENLSKLSEELKQLQDEEEQLVKQLEDVEDEQKRVGNELKVQSNELERMRADEDKYWHEYNNLKHCVFLCDDEQQSVDNQLRYAQAQLDKLKRTNVFNATFHIWHSGQFGTINNFRLGRLPNQPVEWSEINAAWGQAVLLLHSLAKKMNLTFKRCKLVPYGNHSFLESLEDKSRELPLYGSGGFRFFWNTKFDQAMVAYLDCLQQFKEEVEKGDSGFCLPYRMDKGKIEDTKTGNTYSVKIQFNSEEQWTKALKFMLTNLKWALAWVSSQFANK